MNQIGGTSNNQWSVELGLGDAPPIFQQNRICVTEASFTEDGQEATK